ncbi:MAG TPA: gamma-glutamyltransferase family protein [Burkholderiales bacterium]|jgi:gamma-glutamyltranspeptidase/glutathione hydrolase|nr:gamma-glutamyltransferase family protein [Burkholderiales bacterium]
MHWSLPYSSRRSPLFARNVVATSQPLAAQAGLRMLTAGGNAVDAALATAIALTVVEPTMNGIGSDAFAIVWDGKSLYGLNASGRAPAAWSLSRFDGRSRMPTEGWDSVTVPGAVSGWVALSERFGRLPFETLFEPAISYAESGFLVSPVVAYQWQVQAPRLKDQPGFARAFLPNGQPPAVGQVFLHPDQARSLSEIARSRGESFYRGVLAQRIVESSTHCGGAMTLQDLAAHRADWVEPLQQEYRGYRVHELPPNGQGIAALVALGILGHFDLAAFPVDSADSVHLQVEAMKLAFADAYRHVADPQAMQLPVEAMLDRGYLRSRARLIDRGRAGKFTPGSPLSSDTVYLCTADRDGIMVSLIQSNYMGFGSGVVVPGTGISLQNRGAGFILQPGHPNVVAGGKRPFHTIIPGFISRDGVPVMSFGLMGADMQPQGHVQMVVRFADYAQNPQAAADAPRWKVTSGGELLLEESFGDAVAAELARRGHRVVRMPRGSLEFGAAQLIWKLVDGYVAGSEPRRDGQAVGF